MIQCRSHEEGVRVCVSRHVKCSYCAGGRKKKKLSLNLFVGALVVLESSLWCAFLMRVEVYVLRVRLSSRLEALFTQSPLVTRGWVTVFRKADCSQELFLVDTEILVRQQTHIHTHTKPVHTMVGLTSQTNKLCPHPCHFCTCL